MDHSFHTCRPLFLEAVRGQGPQPIAEALALLLQHYRLSAVDSAEPLRDENRPAPVLSLPMRHFSTLEPLPV
jgi:hypothetical protein